MIYTFSASNLCLREPQNKMSINALPLLFRECSQSGSELFMGNDFLIVFIRRSRSKNHMPADSISPIQRIICTITILLPFLRSFGAFPLCHFRRKLIRNLHIFIILVKGIVVPHIDLCHIFPAFFFLFRKCEKAENGGARIGIKNERLFSPATAKKALTYGPGQFFCKQHTHDQPPGVTVRMRNQVAKALCRTTTFFSSAVVRQVLWSCW